MCRHLVQKLLRKQHADYVDRLFTDEEKTKDQLSKRFWTYVKHRRSPASVNIGPLKRGNSLVMSAKERAGMFNNRFISVFSDQTEKIDYNEMTLQATMKDIIIDRNGVHKQLASLMEFAQE